MKSKLIWKKKWLDDKSGYWYSAKVPVLNWEYVVDGIIPYCEYNQENQDYNEFVVGVFLSDMNDDLVKFSKKHFRKKETAMNACEKHLQDTSEKFNKWMKAK